MATFVFFGLAVLVRQAQSQCTPCHPLPTPQPVFTPPVVSSTIIDNTVSNSLANAIQLLIVSNLIENTMKCPKNERTCDPPPIYPIVNLPDIIRPICEAIKVAPYDIIMPPCEPINVVPNICYPDVVPVKPNGCDCPKCYPMPKCECGNYYPAPTCDCGNCYPAPTCDYGNIYPAPTCDYGNIYPAPTCDYGNIYPAPTCECGNYYPVPNTGCECPTYTYPTTLPVTNIGCDTPNYYPMPNIGCDLPNIYPTYAPTFGPMYPCDPIPVTAEILLPSTIPAQLNCNFGYVPNLPCAGKSFDPWASFVDPCGCGKPFGNGFFQ